MLVRSAMRSDVEDLRRLYRQLSESYEDNPLAIGFALVHPTTHVFVVEVAGQVAGTVTLSVRSVPSYGLVGHIDDVVVDESVRRQGIGRLLVEHALSNAVSRGCRTVELTSRRQRKEANAMYQEMGFVRIETNLYRIRCKS